MKETFRHFMDWFADVSADAVADTSVPVFIGGGGSMV